MDLTFNSLCAWETKSGCSNSLIPSGSQRHFYKMIKDLKDNYYTLLIASVGVAAAAAASAYFARRSSSASQPSSSRRTKGLSFPHALMSHRGGAREFVENTLPGFRYSANRLNADLLELDVQLTKDGQVVIFHDNVVDLVTGRTDGKRIGDFLYNDLPRLVIPSDLMDKEQVVNDPDSTRIPLLKELLDEFPLYPMQIDVKNGPEKLVIKVGNLMREYKRQNQTVWGSFRPLVNRMCLEHFGTEIPLFLSLPRALYLKAIYHVGLFSYADLYESCLIMPKHWLFTNKNWIRALRERGISVIVFGMGTGALNSEKLWHEARDLGVTGICTDKPTLLNEWLKDHPLL